MSDFSFTDYYLPDDTGHALSSRLQEMLKDPSFSGLPPVILCIGTDRVIGDCLGPLVGTALRQRFDCPLPVYGSLEAPIHAVNLSETLKWIKKKHPCNTLIAVDASLGSVDQIGTVGLRRGGIRPGSGVQKKLDTAGDIAITGVTNTEEPSPWISLQTARLSVVWQMALYIAQELNFYSDSIRDRKLAPGMSAI